MRYVKDIKVNMEKIGEKQKIIIDNIVEDNIVWHENIFGKNIVGNIFLGDNK